jgi:hypothetical protein
VPLAPLPEWLIAKLGIGPRQASRSGGSRNWQAFARELIDEGERNTALAALLCRKLPRYPDLVYELVASWNSGWCRPPLSEVEVETIVASIGRYDTRRDGTGRAAPP